jgi:non-specific serine/threonine protein kinase
MFAATAGARLDNLPTPLSLFIGREREIAEVKQRLSSHRLVTLTGPGGCGKTRLALRVAGEVLSEFEDGVWLTEFAPLANVTLVPQTVASQVGVREQSGRALLDTLAEHLRPRLSLLVLDNCEHLVAACAQLAEALLRQCPGLRILATSREPLGVSGEAVWIVPPLSLPDPQPWHDPVSGQVALLVYEGSEAVQLFVARASAVSPDFSLSAANGAWVAEICRRLDGMPLAIELAAARVRALSVQQIAERLDDRFHLLIAGGRTAPPRHQTLEATLDWSYTLLSETERKVLQRLSVFAGGWTLEAAEAVCASGEVEASEVLEALSHLVDKSLVVVDKPEGEARYRLLETIRQYIRQKIVDAGDGDAARDRHLNYFVHWTEKAPPHLTGAEELTWLNRFEVEHDNLRAALEWSLAAADRAEAGLRLAGACGRFWRLHGYFSEGRARLSAALSHGKADLPTAARVHALYRAGVLAYLQSDYPASRSLHEESLALSRKLGEAGATGVAEALEMLGEVATEEGDYPIAIKRFEEALTIFNELKDLRGVSDVLMQLGWAAMRTGDYAQAAARLEEFLAHAREVGDPTMRAYALSGLGELAVRQRQYERATQLLNESLALNREIGSKWDIGTVLGSLGWVALRQRDFKQMRALLKESLAVRMEIGDRGGIAWCLEKLAEAANLQGQLQQAVRVFGMAAALRAPVKSVIDPADQPEYERNLATLRAALGEEAFGAAWIEGSAMRLEEAVDYAFSQPETPAVEASPKEKYGGLTEREREVAALIAQGKSNREIAEAMVVGVRTVETYVTRILNKLGLDSRVQIALWAKDKGLI